MWNNHCGYNQVNPAYDMGNQNFCGGQSNYDMGDQYSCGGQSGNNNTKTFVLIVVLFILLIIVGSAFCL